MSSLEFLNLASEWNKRHESAVKIYKESSGGCIEKAALKADVEYTWEKFLYYTNKQKIREREEKRLIKAKKKNFHLSDLK